MAITACLIAEIRTVKEHRQEQLKNYFPLCEEESIILNALSPYHSNEVIATRGDINAFHNQAETPAQN
jgi:hypothetical protein